MIPEFLMILFVVSDGSYATLADYEPKGYYWSEGKLLLDGLLLLR